MDGTACSGITSPPPVWRTTGNFVRRFSRSVFAISLTPSKLRQSNAPWELFWQNNGTDAPFYRLQTAGNLGRTLPTLPRNRNNEFAVFLSYEVFACAT